MNMKQKTITAAMALVLCTGVAHAGPYTSASFAMFDPSGEGFNVDTGVTGEVTGNTFTLASTTPFFGILWAAHSGVVLAPGTYTIDTSTNNDDGSGGTFNDVVVNPDQLGGHILFNWGPTLNIDVVIVWDITYDSNGFSQFISTDGPGTATGADDRPDGFNLQEGFRGYAMLDGAFPGFNANFDINPSPDYAVSLESSQAGNNTLVITNGDGDVSIASNIVEAGATFNWNNGATDSTLITQDIASTFDEDTFVFDPTPLAPGTYSLSVTSANPAGTSVRADLQLTVPSVTLVNTKDTDGDGIDDLTEGFSDSDADGIPDYLDHTAYSPKQLQTSVAGDNTSAPVISISEGSGPGTAISVGSIAREIYNASDASITFYADGTGNGHGPLLSSTDMASDNDTLSSCIGGCFDFVITGLNPDGSDSVRVVLPLSSAIPENPVYRKFNGAVWTGYTTDAANSNDEIASAPASSTGPITCPEPDSPAYTAGLTPGNFCVQLTIFDNGANDADGSLGVIGDPGGIATTNQVNLEDTSPAIDNVGGGWWFLMGLPALIGLRRFKK